MHTPLFTYSLSTFSILLPDSDLSAQIISFAKFAPVLLDSSKALEFARAESRAPQTLFQGIGRCFWKGLCSRQRFRRAP